jgi:hypothetical protein
MNNCEVIDALGTYEIESQVYGVLSLASKIAAQVKNRANAFRFALWLRNINRDLTNFLDNIHAIIEGRKPAPKPSGEPINRERLARTVDDLEHLYRVIEYIYESSRRAGLTNSTLTAGTLRSLKNRNEALLDLADWLEALSEPDKYNRLFERAAREKEAGELLDLHQVI